MELKSSSKQQLSFVPLATDTFCSHPCFLLKICDNPSSSCTNYHKSSFTRTDFTILFQYYNISNNQLPNISNNYLKLLSKYFYVSKRLLSISHAWTNWFICHIELLYCINSYDLNILCIILSWKPKDYHKNAIIVFSAAKKINR